jgi:hypothetical protein
LLLASLFLGLTPCCRENCCEGQGWSSLEDGTTTTTEKPHAHIHLFSNDHRDITALELASVWIGTLLFVFCIVLLSKNIYRSVRTPTILKRLRTYADGPFASTEQTEEGTIVPAVNYFEAEKAKEMFRKKSNRGTRREKEREKRRKKRERKSKNAIIQDDEYLDSMMFLEMQMFQMDDDDNKIIPNVEDKTQEEIIIDEILSMPMDTLMRVKKVPDRLLSPMTERQPPRRMSAIPSSRRMSAIPCSRRGSALYSLEEPDSSTLIPLPSPFSPPYLPTRPVSGILAPNHNTERLYRYTHIERIVYPHERVIVPPGYAP